MRGWSVIARCIPFLSGGFQWIYVHFPLAWWGIPQQTFLNEYCWGHLGFYPSPIMVVDFKFYIVLVWLSQFPIIVTARIRNYINLPGIPVNLHLPLLLGRETTQVLVYWVCQFMKIHDLQIEKWTLPFFEIQLHRWILWSFCWLVVRHHLLQGPLQEHPTL